MNLTNILTSDPALSLILGVAGTAWTLVQSTGWFARLRQSRFNRALRCLEAAVRQVYEEYVRAVKAASEDGILTDDERRRARELARDRAVAIARTEGIDLLTTLGREQIDLWIERTITRLKRD